MPEQALPWLLDPAQPAVAYRARRELLHETPDPAAARAWLQAKMPSDWETTRGLWYTYYLTALAECGMTRDSYPFDEAQALARMTEQPFAFGCADFMALRALVMLGFYEEPALQALLHSLASQQLPDGGFLCLGRLQKLRYTPKSCVKVNHMALLLLGECAKRGIRLEIEPALLDYFWKHRLFYRTDDLNALILNARVGWRAIDAFHPMEVMRVGLHNLLEAFNALGYGQDARLEEAHALLASKRDALGCYALEGTLSKSYLPKERVGQPSRWVTFYALIAQSK